MPYSDHFKSADDLITHLNGVVGAIGDPFLASRYVGFVSVAGVTAYELAVKDIFCDFGTAKHRALGEFARNYFERLNGRIKYEFLWKEYARRFGERYRKRFRSRMDAVERAFLTSDHKSVITSYNNLITWRHSFAHEGIIPGTVNYGEAAESYQIGKKVIDCLAGAMQR